MLRRTARRLEETLRGERLVAAELRWPTAAGADLLGRTVLGTHAYGKHLFTRFDDGRTLHTHLRMDGYWRTYPTGSERAAGALRNPTVRAVLAGAAWSAFGYHLGMLDLVVTTREAELVAHLGPDVLAPEFTGPGLAETLRRAAERATTPVAELLLDQTVAAGLGTIYMAESLFTRRLWPWTATADVPDLPTLYMTARRLMERSVDAPVPTATGEIGRGRGSMVHGRAGLPCRRCGTPVAEGAAGRPPMQRPVCYCPVCQAP